MHDRHFASARHARSTESVLYLLYSLTSCCTVVVRRLVELKTYRVVVRSAAHCATADNRSSHDAFNSAWTLSAYLQESASITYIKCLCASARPLIIPLSLSAAGENPGAHLWPPASSSAYKSFSVPPLIAQRHSHLCVASRSLISIDPSSPRPEVSRERVDRPFACGRRGAGGHGEDSVLRHQGAEERAVDAGGGQAPPGLRPGQRPRQLAHAPQTRR